MKTAIPRPPKTLKAAGRDYWQTVCREFILDPPALRLLEAAARELDRAETSDAILEREGLVVTGPDGRRYPHPCVTVSRDARAAFVRTVKSLRLDVIPNHAGPGRPSYGK
jgi:hypothetical protein